MSSPQQRRWPSRRFLFFTLALCAALPLLARLRPAPPRVEAKPYKFPSEELAALDRAVQARLAIVPDSDFGLGRVGPRHGYFTPATGYEKAAVKDLQKAGQEVVFYVVGRNAILKQQNYRSYTPVQGPVYITPRTPLKVKSLTKQYTQTRFVSGNGVAKDAPSDGELIALSRRVFADDTVRNGTNQQIAKWKVVARPIAASAQQCVDCHNQWAPWKPPEQRRFSLSRTTNQDIISLGDTVGIALYCYRPAQKIETKKLSEDELLARPGQ